MHILTLRIDLPNPEKEDQFSRQTNWKFCTFWQLNCHLPLLILISAKDFPTNNWLSSKMQPLLSRWQIVSNFSMNLEPDWYRNESGASLLIDHCLTIFSFTGRPLFLLGFSFPGSHGPALNITGETIILCSTEITILFKHVDGSCCKFLQSGRKCGVSS